MPVNSGRLIEGERKMSVYRKMLWVLVAGFIIGAGCQPTSPKTATEETKVWKSIYMTNDLIELQVVPEIGGRVLQYKLGDYGFFWVNEQLFDKEPPETRLGPNGEWLNYGGDKIWPAPQGWDNDKQWPGPPDPILDGGPYKPEVLTRDDKPVVVKLSSRSDPRTGIQLSRVIKIFDGTTHIAIDAEMRNLDVRDRRWGIWSHAQFNAGNRKGAGYNKNYWGYCTLDPNTQFTGGYNVMFGLADNPSYKPDYEKKIMQVHYERKLGKIGVDSPGGWVATVDGTNGYVFVQMYNYQAGKEYPDNASVEFWMNGVGEFTAWGKVNKLTDDPVQNPYVFESEMLSPYANLKPGEVYAFNYHWFAAKIGGNFPILDCSKIGAACKPLTAKVRKGRLILDGHYGVFYKGNMQLVFVNKNYITIKTVLLDYYPVSPLAPIIFSEVPKLNGVVEVPQEASKVAVFICNEKGRNIGFLADAEIEL